MYKRVRLTKREKFIVSATDPTFEGFATQKEVDRAYKKARGHCFTDYEFEQVVAVSPRGTVTFFDYFWYSWATPDKIRAWWLLAMRCGKLWAQGKYKQAYKLYDSVDTK